MSPVTAKQLVLQEAPTWSEEQAERALRAVHPEPEAARPGDIIDDWGNLSALRRASSPRKLSRLDEEEIAEHGETIGDSFARAEAERQNRQ
jgi:hypothetical protein